MAHALSHNVLYTVALANNISIAADTSGVDGLVSTGLSMSGFDGIVWMGGVTHGGTGGNVSFQVNSSTATDSSGTVITGSTSTVAVGSSATAEFFVQDVYRPRTRFTTAAVTVASSCAVVGVPIVAIRYNPRASFPSTGTPTGAVPNTTASNEGVTGGVVIQTSPAT